MSYLLQVHLAWFFTVECFDFEFSKLFLSTFSHHSRCSFRSFKMEKQSRVVRFLRFKLNKIILLEMYLFLELQRIGTTARNTLFSLFCMKTKTQSAWIITWEKLAVFKEGFCNYELRQLSDTYIVSFWLSFVAKEVLCLILRLL